MQVEVEVSARHLHLCREHVDILFGEGYELTHKKALSQHGEFVCNERVEVIGSKGSFNISVLAPTRSVTQVELAVTDARKIGVDVVARDSGDVKGSASAVLKGPAGELTLSEGVIVAKRHIHLSTEDAEKINLKNGDKVDVLVEGADDRSLVFKNVLIRVREDFHANMHLDTDEANACGVYGSGVATILI